MKKIIPLFVLFVLTGCCSFLEFPVIGYINNEIVESIGVQADYSIYDNNFSAMGVNETDVMIPAHYQILIPPKKGIRRSFFVSGEKFFLYTQKRGIAIFQDLYDWERVYENGLQQISKETAEDQLSFFEINSEKKIKVKEDRLHFMYVDNEIRILMFNLHDRDYYRFVEFPLANLKIRRRGEVRKRGIYATVFLSRRDYEYFDKEERIQQYEYTIQNMSIENIISWVDYGNSFDKKRDEPVIKYFFQPHGDFALAHVLTDELAEPTGPPILGVDFVVLIKPGESFKYLSTNDDCFNEHIFYYKESDLKKITGEPIVNRKYLFDGQEVVSSTTPRMECPVGASEE